MGDHPGGALQSSVGPCRYPPDSCETQNRAGLRHGPGPRAANGRRWPGTRLKAGQRGLGLPAGLTPPTPTDSPRRSADRHLWERAGRHQAAGSSRGRPKWQTRRRGGLPPRRPGQQRVSLSGPTACLPACCRPSRRQGERTPMLEGGALSKGLPAPLAACPPASEQGTGTTGARAELAPPAAGKARAPSSAHLPPAPPGNTLGSRCPAS